MKELVFQGQNYQALTNSLLVAEKFGKRYDSVFRSINQMIGNSPQKSDKLFVISSYIDSSGKENQMYVMNRKRIYLTCNVVHREKGFRFQVRFL
ncbi:Rha family transcriptional regulator [Bacteroides xylanisolvens]|mgnify:CR=1 FL=1|uniref:Rha family transcriptional regulator n=1 Tax=Bacteroides xylanisolvens TaxID=371601 RepID=UPI003511D04E